MNKQNLFDKFDEIDISEIDGLNRKIYISYGTIVDDRIPYIELKLKPTKHTNTLFKEILNNYNSKESTSLLSFSVIKKLSVENAFIPIDFDIINSMSFGYYRTIEEGDVNLRCPVIIKEFTVGYNYKLEFHEKFMDFYKEYFTIN